MKRASLIPLALSRLLSRGKSIESFRFTVNFTDELTEILRQQHSKDFDLRLDALVAVPERMKLSCVWEDERHLWLMEGSGQASFLSCLTVEGELLLSNHEMPPLTFLGKRECGRLYFHADCKGESQLLVVSLDEGRLQVEKRAWHEPYDPLVAKRLPVDSSHAGFARILRLDLGGFYGCETPPRFLECTLGKSSISARLKGSSLRVDLNLETRPEPQVLEERHQVWVDSEPPVELHWKVVKQQCRDPKTGEFREREVELGSFSAAGEPVSVTRHVTHWHDLRWVEEKGRLGSRLNRLLQASPNLPLPLRRDKNGQLSASARDSSGWRRVRLDSRPGERDLVLIEETGLDEWPLSPETRLKWLKEGIPRQQKLPGELKREELLLATGSDFQLDLVCVCLPDLGTQLVSVYANDKCVSIDQSGLDCVAYSLQTIPGFRDAFYHGGQGTPPNERSLELARRLPSKTCAKAAALDWTTLELLAEKPLKMTGDNKTASLCNREHLTSVRTDSDILWTTFEYFPQKLQLTISYQTLAAMGY